MMGLQEKLSACLRQAVENHEAAGVSLLVLKDGKELCHAREGYADIAAGKQLRRDSIFRLYSQSKPVTAAAAMILVDRGILDLMAPVEQYLPGFANPVDPGSAGNDLGHVLSGRGSGGTVCRPCV